MSEAEAVPIVPVPDEAPAAPGIDPITMLRQLITHEVERDVPCFPLIETYIKGLKTVLGNAKKVGLADAGVESESTDPGGFTSGGIVLTTNTGTNAMMMGDNPYGGDRSKRDVRKDEQLAATAEIVRKAGPDPLAAILQSWDTVKQLFPEQEQGALISRVRRQVEERLPPVIATDLGVATT